MRNLVRDTRPVWVARYEGMEPVVDIQGRLTGKHKPKRTRLIKFYPSASMARGEAQGDYFGLNLDYDKVLTLADVGFEIAETDVLWIDNATESEPTGTYDYTIKKVARTQNFTVIAVKRVDIRA